MAFENYLKEYNEFLEDVRKETYTKYQTEAEMLFEFIDNWIDLVRRDKENFLQEANSLSGVILLNSWKLTNWISYEILCGKYFEAIRSLRFVFEGSVYAVIMEDAIESKVFRKWGSLSSLSRKTEIFQLWEECKKKRVFSGGQINLDLVKRIVANFVDRNIDSPRSEKREEYIELYTEILSDKRLYLTTGRMIGECSNFLKIDKGDIEELKELWRNLSKCLHFSHPYLEVIVDNPGFCFLEGLNDKLLSQSLNFYFGTLDFFYAVLAWRFTGLNEEINKMCKWWKDNFGKTFSITEKILRATQ